MKQCPKQLQYKAHQKMRWHNSTNPNSDFICTTSMYILYMYISKRMIQVMRFFFFFFGGGGGGLINTKCIVKHSGQTHTYIAQCI